MKTAIKIVFFCCIVCNTILGQTLTNVSLLKNSSLTITGTTNVVSFKLFQNGDKFSNKKLSFTTTQNQNKISLSENKLLVAVKDFASDNRMALRDFLKLIKSETYPNLQVQISYIDIQPSAEKGDIYNGNAVVSITITGIKRYYCIPISFNSEKDLYVVNGKKDKHS